MISRLLAVTLGIASTIAISGCESARSDSAVAVAETTSNCEFRLELPGTINIKTHGHAKVQIKNVGKSEVTLVMPGDGSDCRWRTPVVGWSWLPAGSEDPHPQNPPPHAVGRCGNINPLKPNEVFTLKPGEARELNEWISPPYNLPPGKYRVVFYYSNIPDLKWSGIPLGEHDANAMRRVKRSTPVALVSNEVQVEVVE